MISFGSGEIEVVRFSARAGVTGGVEVAAVALGPGTSTYGAVVVVKLRDGILHVLRKLDAVVFKCVALTYRNNRLRSSLDGPQTWYTRFSGHGNGGLPQRELQESSKMYLSSCPGGRRCHDNFCRGHSSVDFGSTIFLLVSPFKFFWISYTVNTLRYTYIRIRKETHKCANDSLCLNSSGW